MNRYDLIAFDMDGTLLDSNHQITQDSLDAIDAAVNARKNSNPLYRTFFVRIKRLPPDA